MNSLTRLELYRQQIMTEGTLVLSREAVEWLFDAAEQSIDRRPHPIADAACAIDRPLTITALPSPTRRKDHD